MPADLPLLILDANVLVRAATNSGGASFAVFELARSGVVRFAVAAAVLADYGNAGQRPNVVKLFSRVPGATVAMDGMVAELRESAVVVTLEGEAPPCRDEKDRPYLHCAIAATADFLLTFDKDLLVQGWFENTRILEPREFLAWFRARE